MKFNFYIFLKIFNYAFLFLKCSISLEFNCSTVFWLWIKLLHLKVTIRLSLLSFYIVKESTVQGNLGSETTADRIALMISAIAQLKTDDGDWMGFGEDEWAGRRVVAPRNESPQLSAQLFASEDAPKAAVNLICLAGDVAGRKTIGEIANRGKRLTEGKSLLAVFFRMRIESYAPPSGPFTVPIMKPLQAAVYFSIVIGASRLPSGYRPRRDFLD